MGIKSKNIDWYAVQTMAGREDSARRAIEEAVDSASYEEVFVPLYRTNKKVGDTWVPSVEPLLPGYLMACTSNVESFTSQLRLVEGFSKVVATGDIPQPLQDEERAWIETWTSRGNRVLDASVGRMEKGRLKIISGPLMGREADVVHVNRRKKQAVIRMNVMGKEKEIKLTLEIVGKDSPVSERRREAP